MPRAAILVFLLSLAVPAAAVAGRQPARVRAVVDEVVGGKVVRRTVVTGPRRARQKRPVTFERERAAAAKGWSVTDRRAAPPRDLRLGGRLEETGARRQKGGQTILTFTRPGARHLTGEREIRVYSRGRLTTSKKLQSRAEKKMRDPGTAVAGGGRGTGKVVRSTIAVEILSGEDWVGYAGMAFRYEPSDPFAVHVEVPGKPDWVFDRDLLADAFRRGTAGSTASDVRLKVEGDHLEILLTSNSGSARLRTPARGARAFLAGTQASVPPGSEREYFDVDRELRRFLDPE